MRVTSRGRITIPKEIRDRHGITPGTEVDFFLEDGFLVLRKRKAQPDSRKPKVEDPAGSEKPS